MIQSVVVLVSLSQCEIHNRINHPFVYSKYVISSGFHRWGWLLLVTFTRHSMAGKYGFNVHFPEANGNIWIYRPEDRKLFVKMNTDFDVDFQFQKCPSLPFTIEAAAYHHDKGVFGDAVNVCVKHLPTGRSTVAWAIFCHIYENYCDCWFFRRPEVEAVLVQWKKRQSPRRESGYQSHQSPSEERWAVPDWWLSWVRCIDRYVTPSVKFIPSSWTEPWRMFLLWLVWPEVLFWAIRSYCQRT